MTQLKTTSGQIVTVDPEDKNGLYDQYKAGGALEYTTPPLTPSGPSSNILSSDNLTNVPDTPFINQPEQPVDDISGLDFQPMQMTNPEIKAQGISDNLLDLNNTLYGESAYRAEQEDKQGMADLLKTQNDLTNRFNTLKAQQDMIPLQIQQESIGRGRTAGGVAPLETARLRNNAIDALTTGALLQASQGNITTAQTLIDRAVAQKFDPIREQISILERNLKIIKESPEYSLEDKNRAEMQLAVQEQKKAALDQEQADRKEILTLAAEAAKFGATSEEIMAISQAGSVEEAMAMASPYMAAEYEDGLYKQALDEEQQAFENSLSTGEFNLKKGQIEADLEQRAFDNGLALEELELKREMFETDTDYRNAELVLDEMKLNANSEIKYQKINGVDYQINPDGSLGTPELPPEEVTQATTLQEEAGTAAKNLLDKFNARIGTSAVGASRFWGAGGLTSMVAGSEGNDFTIDFDNLVSKLQLDAVKYLKGQGQVSDAERRILANATSNLKLSKSEEEFKKSLQDIVVTLGQPGQIELKSDGTYIYKNMDGTVHNGQQGDNYVDKTLDLNFSQVGSDTNKATTLNKLTTKKDGEKGGQCGKFVNNLTGIGLGDSYESKLAKMDPKIKKPEPGMVFVMPLTGKYQEYGHTGFVVGINEEKGTVIVKDSNWGSDEKIKTHEIPMSKITGYRRVA